MYGYCFIFCEKDVNFDSHPTAWGCYSIFRDYPRFALYEFICFLLCISITPHYRDLKSLTVRSDRFFSKYPSLRN